MFCSLILHAAERNFDARKGLGQDYVDANGLFATHAVVKEFPMEGESRFTASVNGSYVGLYNDMGKWDGLIHFGSFEFEDGKEITIRISYYKKIETFELLPAKRLKLIKVKQTSDNTISITLDRADQNLTLIVNGDPQKDALHLFCNSIDHNAPRVMEGKGIVRDDTRKLIYFATGYHDLTQEIGDYTLMIPDGYRVYLAPGAVVHGSLVCCDAKWIQVDGRGMVYDDKLKVVFNMQRCESGIVQGVLFHGHRAQMWQVILDHCRGVEFQGVKILSTRYACTDGLDVVNCQYCTFRNCFIRSNDDAVTLKGMEQGKNSECTPITNITFSGVQLWNDCNCACVIGEESHAAYYQNIHFTDCSILYSYDDPDHHEELPERAALTICCLHSTFFRNIRYENIDIYHCERFIAMGFQPSFWFGSIPGDQTGPGGISGVTLSNVHCYSNSGSKIANKIHLYGWKKDDGTPDKWVDGVIFRDVTIEGQPLESTSSPYFSETEWDAVKNISFR